MTATSTVANAPHIRLAVKMEPGQALPSHREVICAVSKLWCIQNADKFVGMDTQQMDATK